MSFPHSKECRCPDKCALFHAKKPADEPMGQAEAMDRLVKALEKITEATCAHGDNTFVCEACWFWRGERFRGERGQNG